MFWALAQREKDRKKWREEALKEGLEQGLEQGLEIGRENERDRIARELAERGIELPQEALEIIKALHIGNGGHPRNP